MISEGKSDAASLSNFPTATTVVDDHPTQAVGLETGYSITKFDICGSYITLYIMVISLLDDEGGNFLYHSRETKQLSMSLAMFALLPHARGVLSSSNGLPDLESDKIEKMMRWYGRCKALWRIFEVPSRISSLALEYVFLTV
jgi:hypothetical protein